mgnify:CR=1 FL=1
MKKYYIEIVNVEMNEYIIQSKWFETEEDAISFMKENFDFIDTGTYAIDLMSAEFDEEGVYGDIKLERRLYGGF